MEEKKHDINQFKKQEAFKVPANYFEDFALNMQNEIVSEQPKSGLASLFSLANLKVLVPSFALVIICFSIYHITSSDLAYVPISAADITEYILQEEEYQILDEYEELLASNLNLDEPSVSDEDIIDYLVNEEIELDLLTQ